MGRIIFWSIASALAGLLFGFDTVVISGAESKIQNLWSLSGAMHGFAISSALWGTVLGALIGSIPTNKWGRKKTLIFNGVLLFVSAVWSALAWDLWSFSIARFIGGIGIGIATISTPLFISEIAPASHRGRLTALFQFNIVFGILLAFFSNYVIGIVASEEIAWRWMLGVEAIPALLYTVLCFTLPESPRYLITNRGDIEHGRAVFKLINPTYSEKQIDDLVAEVQTAAAVESNQAKIGEVFTRKLMYPMLFAFLIAAFNQLSGINIILYFAPRLLGLAGLEDPLSASIALGVTNLIFTFVGLKFIDILGRRTLLILGCIGYLVSLGICTFAFVHFNDLKVVSASIDMVNSAAAIERTTDPNFYMTDADREQIRVDYEAARAHFVEVNDSLGEKGLSVNIAPEASSADLATAATEAKNAASERLGGVGYLVLGCMMLFIAAHALGSGTIIWVFISEIFPARFRAAGQSLGSFTHWIFAAMLTLIFPIFIANFDVSVMFGFFFVMMALQLLWALVMMPETKGKTLEELSVNLIRDKA